MGEMRYCTTGVVLYLELPDVFIKYSPLQTAIDALYDTSCGHEEGVHESVPIKETHPPSPGPAMSVPVEEMHPPSPRTSHSWDHPPLRLLLQTSRENVRSTASVT